MQLRWNCLWCLFCLFCQIKKIMSIMVSLKKTTVWWPCVPARSPIMKKNFADVLQRRVHVRSRVHLHIYTVCCKSLVVALKIWLQLTPFQNRSPNYLLVYLVPISWVTLQVYVLYMKFCLASFYVNLLNSILNNFFIAYLSLTWQRSHINLGLVCCSNWINSPELAL